MKNDRKTIDGMELSFGNEPKKTQPTSSSRTERIIPASNPGGSIPPRKIPSSQPVAPRPVVEERIAEPAMQPITEDITNDILSSFDVEDTAEEEVRKETSEEVNFKEANVSNLVEDKIEFFTEPTVEEDLKKGKKKKEKKPKTPASIAGMSLFRASLWAFVVILSIIFGAYAINRFIIKLDDFASAVRPEDSTFWDGFGAFWPMFLTVWEAGLFAFFIVYSSIQSFAKAVPFFKWYKETAPDRIAKKLKAIKAKEIVWKEEATSLSIKFKEVVFNKEIEPKKEIEARKKLIEKLKKKINKINTDNKNKIKELKAKENQANKDGETKDFSSDLS